MPFDDIYHVDLRGLVMISYSYPTPLGGVRDSQLMASNQ